MFMSFTLHPFALTDEYIELALRADVYPTLRILVGMVFVATKVMFCRPATSTFCDDWR